MCVQLTPEQIAHELHMEKILVMFSLLLFSTWSFYFVRLKSAFSNNKKPYRGQSRVLPLILITNLYSKFQRVFCPDSLDVRYTHRHPVWKSFRPRCSWTLHSSLLRSLSSWQMGVARRGVTMTVKWMLKFLSDRRLLASTTVSTLYSWLADWILPVSDSPSSVTAHYHGETSARTAAESLLLELNLAWRLRETLTLSNRVMQSPYKGEGIQMVTKVSLWISTTETCKNSRTKTITLL